MLIVGLVGPRGAGKDAVASILKEQKRSHGKISFAEPLKRLCSEVFGLPLVMMNDPVHKENKLREPITLTKQSLREIRKRTESIVDPQKDNFTMKYRPGTASLAGLEGVVCDTPRSLMQTVGTDFIRNRIYKDWHVEASFSETNLKGLVKSGTYCVTDIRFLNEFTFLKEKFGNAFVCYYVERPEAEENLTSASHQSELEVLKIREMPGVRVISNHGNLKDLNDFVSDMRLPESEKPKRGFVFR